MDCEGTDSKNGQAGRLKGLGHEWHHGAGSSLRYTLADLLGDKHPLLGQTPQLVLCMCSPFVQSLTRKEDFL